MSTTTTREREIIELETRFWSAIRDGDATAASSMVDDTCVVTGAQGNGAVDPATFAKMMEAPQWKLHEFSFEKESVTFPTDDVAIIAYTVTEELTVDGKPLTLRAADASTWVKREGQWHCALHTESVLGDPFGRDRRAS
ncbi:MAG TPA: nuclear transport factor 2 family protein [Gemmatimonadaceae bacterium]|nr:nuclear transport factor 2 family protein [Gemmatimonadaceae bacterium]